MAYPKSQPDEKRICWVSAMCLVPWGAKVEIGDPDFAINEHVREKRLMPKIVL